MDWILIYEEICLDSRGKVGSCFKLVSRIGGNFSILEMDDWKTRVQNWTRNYMFDQRNNGVFKW